MLSQSDLNIFIMNSPYQFKHTAPNTVAAALPTSSLNQLLAAPSSEPPSPFLSMLELPPSEVLSRHKGKHGMSRQQWEDMKPLIQRIYLDENKPFPYLAHALCTEYGFEPT
jgi:Clr5 domain